MSIGCDFGDSDSLAQSQTERLELDGHEVEVTKVFWTYWYFAAERQQMFMRRVRSQPGPWTDDPILATYRFTNAYRASDRVSQYLLHRVIYSDNFDASDMVLRVLLFKIFNRVETWEHIVSHLGEPTVDVFERRRFTEVLDLRFDNGERLYSAAYIMPSPHLGYGRKHANHLALLEELIHNGTLNGLLESASLEHLFRQLIAIPSFGPFLAFQYAIDLNYSSHFNFDEMEFVVPGPGALRGISKCFTDTGGLDPSEIIRAMTNAAPTFTSESDVVFNDLWGRPLQLIDCQNLFCEVDKYARVAHPEIGSGGPTRIKQTYSADPRPLTLGYPPKWGLPWSADEPNTFGTPTSSDAGRSPKEQSRVGGACPTVDHAGDLILDLDVFDDRPLTSEGPSIADD